MPGCPRPSQPLRAHVSPSRAASTSRMSSDRLWYMVSGTSIVPTLRTTHQWSSSPAHKWFTRASRAAAVCWETWVSVTAPCFSAHSAPSWGANTISVGTWAATTSTPSQSTAFWTSSVSWSPRVGWALRGYGKAGWEREQQVGVLSSERRTQKRST